eukprot:CAMPEP_0181066722 /NCGR_PEP_ID=MMETSP1070-20121207/25492_1 /TAXON_ID=265543 /ORGANISM="Minutocellus polymorphus, Strain NH13" /LENGTH=333 /DNA_ID=CAMNT_0023147335 /DNA_START=462 /DNA_END=1463 /DNA_ORIENTATION=+
MNAQQSNKVLNESNPCYIGDETEVARTWSRVEAVIGRTDDHRSRTVESWLEGRKVAATVSVALLPGGDGDEEDQEEGSSSKVGSTEAMRRLYSTLSTYYINSNFSSYNILSFDDSTMSKSNPKQSFWWQQHEIATGKKFEARRKNLPVALSQSQVGAGIVAFHLARLFDAWVDKAIIDTFAGNESSLSTTTVTAASAAATADIPEDDANSESTNFVGWAMKETLDMYRDVWRSSDDYDRPDTQSRRFVPDITLLCAIWETLDAQKKIFEKIVTKAFHARAGEATKRYKEDKLDAADMAPTDDNGASSWTSLCAMSAASSLSSLYLLVASPARA